jgi:hypothetical protein
VERWSALAEGAWSLEPGTEDVGWCKSIVLDEEIYISALRPIASPGTHHISLNLASPDDSDCTSGRLGPETVYAAGPGAGELRMPPQVAMRLARGQALHLNLHVYNPTAGLLDGMSGIEIVRAKNETVKDEAGFVLAGPESVILPPAQRTTITSTCRFAADQTAFALLPLMHEHGVSFKTTVTHEGEPTVLYDAAFRFEEQSEVPIGMIAVRSGDSITTECTFDNAAYHPVKPGHEGAEICFSALLRYPSGATVDCAEPGDEAEAH